MDIDNVCLLQVHDIQYIGSNSKHVLGLVEHPRLVSEHLYLLSVNVYFVLKLLVCGWGTVHVRIVVSRTHWLFDNDVVSSEFEQTIQLIF